jgi:uncharacterized membrane protein YoaK (UPF0700 family)
MSNSSPPALPARPETGAMPQRLVTILAFIAGYVDTVGFVALYGLFTSHVTANFVLLGANLTGDGSGIALKLLAFPAFIAGVATAKIATDFHLRRGSNPERTMYVLQAVFLACMLAAGLAALPIHAADANGVIASGLFGAFAMGVQNGHSRLGLAAYPQTTMMTQNVSQAVIDSIDAVSCRDLMKRHGARARLVDTLLPVFSFAVGAIVAAIGYQHVSFWTLLFPVTLLAILSLRASTATCAVGE